MLLPWDLAGKRQGDQKKKNHLWNTVEDLKCLEKIRAWLRHYGVLWYHYGVFLIYVSTRFIPVFVWFLFVTDNTLMNEWLQTGNEAQLSWVQNHDERRRKQAVT